jgi:hypothetical protein
LSPLAEKSDQFLRRVSRYQSCCVRIEDAFDKNKLQVSDVELVYCSSFLSVCCQWESFLEEVLYEVTCGEESRRLGNQRYITVRNRPKLQELLLFQRRDYLSLPNLKQAQDITALFVKNGRPISAVSEPNRTFLEQAVRIRNAIAHESSFAKKKFREGVPGVRSLPTTKRTPGAFLRHEFRQAPAQRRYELYFTAYRSAANEIAKAW